MPLRKPNPELEPQGSEQDWEAKLTAEGMPAELPPGLAGYFEDSDTAQQAARAYAQDRARARNVRGFDSSGEHARMASAIAGQFELSEEEAMYIVEAEFERVDRLRRLHG